MTPEPAPDRTPAPAQAEALELAADVLEGRFLVVNGSMRTCYRCGGEDHYGSIDVQHTASCPVTLLRLLAQRPAAQPPALAEEELEGMRAALARQMPTHSPYVFGPAEAQEAWLRGWQPVRTELDWWQAYGAQEALRGQPVAPAGVAGIKLHDLKTVLSVFESGNPHPIHFENSLQDLRAALAAAEAGEAVSRGE